MTERPPSAEAMKLASRHADGEVKKCAAEIDTLCEQRVSAETERCAMVAGAGDHDDCEHGAGYMDGRLDAMVAILATAERPAPPPALDIIERWQTRDRQMYPPSAEQPASPAAVVDYTERARGIISEWLNRDFGSWVDTELAELRELIADALSAVASEQQAEIEAFRERVNYFKAEYQDEDGLITLRFERDEAMQFVRAALLARLQEPEVREAVARAMCKRRNTKQCAAICLSHSSLVPSGECTEAQIVWGEDAGAAIARIAEMHQDEDGEAEIASIRERVNFFEAEYPKVMQLTQFLLRQCQKAGSTIQHATLLARLQEPDEELVRQFAEVAWNGWIHYRDVDEARWSQLTDRQQGAWTLAMRAALTKIAETLK
jgi:hypothetical protein